MVLQNKRPHALILHNIRSSENVGSIFRTADASGISHIFLTGYSPSPVDRFGRLVQKVLKASLGAEQSVSWSQEKDVFNLLKKIKKEKKEIIAIEQHTKSVDYKKIKIRKPTVFILGNEVEGLPENLLSHCDQIAEIPLSGKKESLNVAVATGVALFRMLNR